MRGGTRLPAPAHSALAQLRTLGPAPCRLHDHYAAGEDRCKLAGMRLGCWYVLPRHWLGRGRALSWLDSSRLNHSCAPPLTAEPISILQVFHLHIAMAAPWALLALAAVGTMFDILAAATPTAPTWPASYEVRSCQQQYMWAGCGRLDFGLAAAAGLQGSKHRVSGRPSSRPSRVPCDKLPCPDNDTYACRWSTW